MSGGVKHWIEKLSSDDADERLCACQAIGGLSDELVSIPESQLKDIVTALIPLLKDVNVVTQISAVRALRNLCSDIGDVVCQKLAADLTTMTSIFYLLSASPNVSHEDDNGVNLSSDNIQLEVIYLLTDLCVNCEEAVCFFNKNEGATVVLPFLVGHHDDIQLRTAAGELFQILTENNSDMAKVLLIPDNFSSLSNVIAAPHTNFQQFYIKIVTCSIIYNILHNTDHVFDSQVLPSVVQLLCSALEFSCKSTIEEMAAASGSQAMDAEIKAKVEELKYLLKLQQVTLETIANIFATDSDDEWEDADDTDAESNTVREEQPMEDVAMDDGSSESGFSAALQSALTSENIVSKVFSLLNLGDLAALETVKCSKKHSDALRTRMTRKLQALLGCLSNLLLCFEVEKLGGPEALLELLNFLLDLVKKCEGDDVLLLEVTSAVNSTARKLVTANFAKFTEMCPTYLRVMFDLKTSNGSIQVNLLRSISAVGVHVAKLVPTSPELSQIAEYLFHVASGSELVWVSAEALDAFFDVFAEDETDPILREFCAVQKLQSLLPQFTQKCRSSKKSCSGEERLVVYVARTNLPQFIAYKSARM